MAMFKTETAVEPDSRKWVSLYTQIVSTIGLLLLLLAFFFLPVDRAGLLAFSVLAGVAELLSVHLNIRSRNCTVSVSGIVALSSIVVLGPLAGVLVHLVTATASVVRTSLIAHDSITDRATWMRRLGFNMGMWMIASAAAAGLYLLTGGTIGFLYWRRDVLSLALMAFTDISVNIALLTGMIALQTGRRPWVIWKDDFLWTVPITFVGSIFGGGLLAVAYAVLGLPGVGLVFLPVLAIGYAFHLYSSHTRGYVEQLAHLHTIASELQTRSGNLSEYLEQLQTGRDNLRPDQQKALELATQQTGQVSELAGKISAAG